MAASILTVADVKEHSENLRKWLPVYYRGSFWLSEKKEQELLDRFITTFGEKEKGDHNE